MSKRRSLDSKIRQSQSFAKLTYRQRDLWQGLIAIADDQGRFPGTQAHVRSLVWPLDDITLAEVEIDLLRLIELQMIYRYQVNGETFIQIINWWKYQKIQRPEISDHPAPDGWIDRNLEGNYKHKRVIDGRYSWMLIRKKCVRQVFARDPQACKHCGSIYELEIDHIIPIAKGGSNNLDNLQILCKKCNRKKWDK